MTSNTSSYDPDQIHLSESKMYTTTQKLDATHLTDINQCQTTAKWGHQPGPMKFKSAYTSQLSTLESKLSHTHDSTGELWISLDKIRDDANDADLEATLKAGRIAADQVNTTQSNAGM